MGKMVKNSKWIDMQEIKFLKNHIKKRQDAWKEFITMTNNAKRNFRTYKKKKQRT